MKLSHALIAVSALALTACGGGGAKPSTKAHPVGTTLHYVRSNQDGTLAERVLVHVAAADSLNVAKMVAPCTDAALVTAKFDPASGEAIELVGGRLQRDGSQLPQARLTLDPATRKLNLLLGDAAPKAESLAAPPAPWRMYDFDLAEFALFGPREKKDFTFGLALAWPDGPPPLVKALGEAHAIYTEAGKGVFGPLLFFRVEGAGFTDTDAAGAPTMNALAIDADYGHIVEARLGQPNHAGYTDFKLKLEKVEAGEDKWQAALAAHWDGCPV